MNCFGRSQHHLICITQVFRYHRTGQPINQQVWNLKTHATCSSLFVVFNYKCIPDACPFAVMSTWQFEKSTIQLQEIQDTQRAFPVRAHTDYMSAPYIPDTRLETHGRYYLYEIGFLTVAGCLCMAGFQ